MYMMCINLCVFYTLLKVVSRYDLSVHVNDVSPKKVWIEFVNSPVLWDFWNYLTLQNP